METEKKQRKPIDYSKTKIYYIQVGEKIYVGHTTEEYLSQYENKKHKNNYVMFLNGTYKTKRKIYQAMKDLNWTKDEIHCTWLEDATDCKHLDHAKTYELKWMNIFLSEGIELLNTVIPFRNHKQYNDDTKQYRKEYIEKNREKYLKYFKDRYEANKEEINAKYAVKYKCGCGSTSTINHKARHERSQKHLKWLEENA